MRPFLQNFPHAQQEHDGTGGVEVFAEKRNADGGGIQHRHLQTAAAQAPKPVPQVFQGLCRYPRMLQRRGQEQLGRKADENLQNQLFPVPGVQLAPRIFQHAGRRLNSAVLKPAQRLHHLASIPCVAHNGAAGLFSDLGGRYKGQPLQVILQQIRLPEGHVRLGHADADAARNFMLNDKFQRLSLRSKLPRAAARTEKRGRMLFPRPRNAFYSSASAAFCSS